MDRLTAIDGLGRAAYRQFMARDAAPILLWPRWMERAGPLLEIAAHLRSCCSQCQTLLRVEPADLVARRGPGHPLIDTLERCTKVGCAGSTYYLARRGFDSDWTALVRDPGLRGTVLGTAHLRG
jgi:hypothetical protein